MTSFAVMPRQRTMPYSKPSSDCTLGRAKCHPRSLCCCVLAMRTTRMQDGDRFMRFRLSVTSSANMDRKLAERYLLHETIQQYKLALHHRTYAARINEEPISQEDFDSLKEERDLLVDRFGTPFKEDYGWASSVIKKARPTMRDIEEHVELDHIRPYYRMASDNVHANSHGAYFRIGLDPDNEQVLLAGASNMGLADPGHSTAISLCQISINLLTSRSNLDSLVISRILSMLMEETGQAFLEAHHELERTGQSDACNDER